MTTTREYPATQFTYIVVNRKDNGQIETAELWSGFGEWDKESFMLDVYDPASGRVDHLRRDTVVHRRLGLSGWDVPWVAVRPDSRPGACRRARNRSRTRPGMPCRRPASPEARRRRPG